ncbi:C40 family peptidase [Mangrovibacillus cuniculi]|uniref:Hydrolase n=1 Tax=Mangrovibacillus cuniculi TaxID=2593652 RepID=A0A7S8CCN9_9BACI|nr:C40 family peptidase [Mangrovibacillus cuniculi]QPC47564.1 hydrolase [Mangrovibacillus cuniculi]
MKKLVTFVTLFLFSISFYSVGHAKESQGESLVEYAKKFIGVPYAFGGTTPSAFDCSGFMLYVYKEFGISLPRTSASQSLEGQAVAKSDLQPGDLVFFANTYKSGVSHAGIYIGDNKFISATSSKGVKIDSINDPYYWGSRYHSARRVLSDVSFSASDLPTLPAGQYHDVTSKHWAFSAITSLGQQGIISGYDHSIFEPSNDIKRSEVAKMIADKLNLKPSSSSQFSDVPSTHWAFGYINTLAEQGLMGGYGNDRFLPNQAITRGEIAALFTRVFAFSANNAGKAKNFHDISNHWAKNSISELSSHNIVTGYNDGTFKPNNSSTRAEFSVFLYRVQ